MLILTLRTDKPEAELALYENNEVLHRDVWQAHRELSDTIHKRLDNALDVVDQTLNRIEGIVVYKGPGSFTGIRIGVSVAQALALANEIPLIGTAGASWEQDGIEALKNNQGQATITPDYGASANITKPKK